MTPAELKEKQIAIEASIRTLEEQLETAKNHQRELFVLEADLVITKDIQSGVHAAALANRKAQEALDEVAAEWKKIIKRIGANTIRKAYAVGVALEDNKN